MNSLAARKKALVAESEVYRQALRIEVQNVRLYAAQMKKRFNLLHSAKPLLTLLPLLAPFLGRRAAVRTETKPKGWRRWLNTGLLGWRMYRSMAPFLRTLNS
ncbi:MAG TPA: hypothetical protein VHI52_12260, partial [Verrucomicrobiae bacterium]|nr:hypothetical protein [Verrucomicrobiae bacterium]